MERYPDTIELTPDRTGVFHPDFDATPSQPLAIYEPPVDPATLNQLPPPAPRYDSGSKGLSDADIADFGTDKYGRPNVVRDHNGRATWNIDTELPKSVTDGVADALDEVADNRAVRRRAGRWVGAAAARAASGPVGQAITFYEITQATGDLADWLTRPAGEAIGKWLNDKLRGNQPTGKPSGTVPAEGEPEFQGGQCATTYNGFLIKDDGPGRPLVYRSFSIVGPVAGIKEYEQGGKYIVSVVNSRGHETEPIFAPFKRDGKPNIIEMRLSRRDGQEDNCGNPAGPPTKKPTTPTGTKPGNNYPPTTIYDPPPDLPGTDRDSPPTTIYDPPPEPDPPTVPDLPPETDPPETGDPPTKQPECCPSTELSLAEIKALLNKVLSLVRGSGAGSIDLKPCDYEAPVIPFGQSGLEQPEVEPMTADYEGAGVQGIFDAIAAITQSLNLIHTDTKCPPDIAPALPMFWELKRGEIPQLVVVWTKLSGGTSKWSMTIPHPRADIDSSYPFSFPIYKKGGNMASAKLTDNSQLIINAFSEGEAQRVIDYIATLIDPAFIPSEGLRMVYSKNVAEYLEIEVEASYVKKYQGHRTAAPLWGISL